jgi:ubiquinone/menaquinone biosynthesis C-methylase UbiE
MTTTASPQQAMAAQPDDPIYWLGRDDAEARRLIRQSRLYAPSTRWILERAGLGPGMKVLDVGSGSGDVALAARELVGERGAVVGVDPNPDILHFAQSRAQSAGYDNVTFHPGDIRTVGLDHDFDAVVGRFVLMYIGDPVAAIANGMQHLKPGGLVAFQEMNLTPESVSTSPSVPLWDLAWSWVCGAARKARIETEMGYRMREVFLAAGLARPQMQLTANVGSGPDDEVYDYFATTLRSMLPLIAQTGVATAEQVEVDTLAERLRAATLAVDATVKYPNLVGAWSYKAM